MFDVLLYVYENYRSRPTRPSRAHLEPRLSRLGFGGQEIAEAMDCLDGLDLAGRAASGDVPESHRSDAMRCFVTREKERLGVAGMGYLHALERAGQLSPSAREFVIDRVVGSSQKAILVEDLQVLVEVVNWRRFSAQSTGKWAPGLLADFDCTTMH